MLHSINEVCELTGKSRSSIYRMFSRGDLNYTVGKDGKRRVETSELTRVFDTLHFRSQTNPAAEIGITALPESSHQAESIPSSATKNSTVYASTQEMAALRGMINDLKTELGELREDNRRLLRLLEYKTVEAQQNQDDTLSVASMLSKSGDTDETDLDESHIPVTEVAGHDWKAYKKQRTKQEQLANEQQFASESASDRNETGMNQEQSQDQQSQKYIGQKEKASNSTHPEQSMQASNPKSVQPKQPDSPELSKQSSAFGELTIWLKDFFFGEWQKRSSK